jgi:hypothetical protein
MGNDHPKDYQGKSGLKSPRGESRNGESRETLGTKKRTSFDDTDEFTLNDEEGLPADIYQTYVLLVLYLNSVCRC